MSSLERFIAIILTLIAARFCGDQPPRTPAPQPSPVPPVEGLPPDDAEQEFRLGLEAQQKAEALRKRGDPRACELFDRAAGHYRRYLQLRPGSTPALNNLSLVTFDCTRNPRALDPLLEAINAHDPMEAFYRRNLADLLAASGDWKRAVEHYRRVLELRRGETGSRRALLDLQLRHDPAGLTGSLASSRFAAEDAVAIVRDAYERTPEAGAAALLGVANSLAWEIESTETQPELDAALAPLAVHEPVAELRTLLARGSTDPGAYRWWTARPERRNAFVTLAQSVAQSDLGAGRTESAGAFYRLALEAGVRSDPRTATPLLDFLAGTRAGAEEIDAVIAAMHVAAFIPDQASYEFHRAAGVAYAEAGRWEVPGSDRDALFHLTAAESVAARIGLQPEAGVADYLSEARERAAAIRLTRDGPRRFFFETNEHEIICPNAVIDDIVRVLRADPQLDVLVEGHTDDRHTEDYNQGLSQRRARAVADCLAQRIDSRRLEVAYHGESRPIDTNETAAGRQRNRRVDCTYVRRSGK